MRTEEEVRSMYEKGIVFMEYSILNRNTSPTKLEKQALDKSLENTYAELKVLEWILGDTDLDERTKTYKILNMLGRKKSKLNKLFAYLSKKFYIILAIIVNITGR